MTLRKLSIRLRLTLWYAVILMVILVIIASGIYLFMQNKLESMVLSKLDIGYATVETVIRNSRGDLYDVVHLGHDSHFYITRNGEPAYLTKAWDSANLPTELDRLNFDPYGLWSSPEGRLYKLKRGTITAYGFELVFAQEATEIQDSLRILATILLAGIPCAVILALVGGYFLAGRALSPINAVTLKAREITAENLSERLPVSNPNDEIGRLAAVFNNTLARLERSFEQLRRFTADASHELRTPLTSIRSVGEVALQGPQDRDSYREVIGSMLEETERLTRLVDNLLTLARGDSGRVQLTRRPLDLVVLVVDVVDELRILAEEKSQVLSMHNRPSIMVTAHSATIRQAVTNILHNAIRYTQQEGHIDVMSTTTDDGHAVVEITDDGPGIPEPERARIFERFYRVDEARSRAQGGAGLGLAIARWAVEANKGHIEFCHKKGPGSCCRITLPMK